MCHVDSQYCTVYVYDDEYVTACTAVSVSCMYCVYLTRRPQTQQTFGRRPRLTHKCHPQAAPLVTAPLTQLALPIQAIDVMAKSGCSGVSVMRAELDATTTTEVDTHEAQWRAGVNRQAQPEAASRISSEQAASRAAAAKRQADAMSAEEKVEAERRRADRR